MIAVIGGGPAGRIAAMQLANGGEEVSLITKGELGGQCLHHGCMTICALNDVARMCEFTRNLHGQGVVDSVPAVSFQALLRGMKEVQATITRVLEDETKDAGVRICRGEARVDGSNLSVDGKQMHADGILIATGSEPEIPKIEGIGLKGVINPHTLSSLPDIPEELVIIGGGVIAAEYAYIFSMLGSRVTMLCRSTFLRGMNEQLQKTARRDLGAVNIREACTVERINGSGSVESATVRTEGVREEIGADAVLMAAGLRPRTALISGLEKGPLGELVVDSAMRTSEPGVYAAGDVTGPPYLTPLARREGMIAADTILGKARPRRPAVFPQSIKLGYDHTFCSVDDHGGMRVRIPSPSGSGSFWSVPGRFTGTSMLEVDPEDGRITGMYAAAPGTSMMGAYLAYLISNGARVEELEDLIEVHPSTDGIYGLFRYSAALLRRQG